MRKFNVMLPPLALGWLVLSSTAQAASFDCGKAQRKVEHLICDNPEISKLDEELSVAYKTAVQDAKQAHSIRQAQKQWIQERNACADAACVKGAYEFRLPTFAVTHAPSVVIAATKPAVPLSQAKAEVPTYSKEADKMVAIKRIMAKEKFESSSSYTPDKSLCGEFLQDLQQMQGIEFVEPVARSEKYDDSVWTTYKASCPELELFGGYYCEPRMADYVESLPKEEQKQRMNTVCSHFQGTEKFKLYKVDINDNPEDGVENVFYAEREQGPLNKSNEKLIDSDGGYQVVDMKKCQTKGGVRTNDPYSYSWHHPLENYNGIITYKGKHYVVDLFELDVKARTPEKTTYDLTLSGFSGYGVKREPWLRPICSFNTLVTQRK